jgi:nitroimidazol reductase NimA-like FMN-containing flavoprotein (pyridoxamine 5'-phosphate oxidase superfamily)
LIGPNQHEPTSRRLKFPRGYQIAASDAPLLPWSHVAERLERAHNYWLATTRPDGRPHVTPVWGAWVDDAFYFDGIWTARWARNLATNPAATVHLESGTDV